MIPLKLIYISITNIVRNKENIRNCSLLFGTVFLPTKSFFAIIIETSRQPDLISSFYVGRGAYYGRCRGLNTPITRFFKFVSPLNFLFESQVIAFFFKKTSGDNFDTERCIFSDLKHQNCKNFFPQR